MTDDCEYCGVYWGSEGEKMEDKTKPSEEMLKALHAVDDAFSDGRITVSGQAIDVIEQVRLAIQKAESQ